MESFVRDFVIARVLSFLGGRNNRASSRDVVVATHEEDLTYRVRFRPVTIFSSSFAHPCGRSFIRRSTPPSIFCNFYQARFAPPVSALHANVFRQRPVAKRLWILCCWPYFGRGREYLRMS